MAQGPPLRVRARSCTLQSDNPSFWARPVRLPFHLCILTVAQVKEGDTLNSAPRQLGARLTAQCSCGRWAFPGRRAYVVTCSAGALSVYRRRGRAASTKCRWRFPTARRVRLRR